MSLFLSRKPLTLFLCSFYYAYNVLLFQLVPVGYGINKLTIMCTVVDDKVSIEELQEKIEAFEDFVQSCDVAAMNKI